MTCPCSKPKMPGAVFCYRCTKRLQRTKKGRRLYRLAVKVGTPLDLRHAARRGAEKILLRSNGSR